jgi:hypothetical protein
MADVHALDLLQPEPGAIYVMDRGYVDFGRLHAMHLAGAFFVTRAKSNLKAYRVYSAKTDRLTGIICDQTIALDGFYTKQEYPMHLRRIRFKDAESGKTLVFLTNQMTLPATAICALYKSRWQVELFFKWIKRFSVRQRMRSRRKSGSRFRSMSWSPLSKSASISMPRSTLCYRFYRSPFSRRCPCSKPFRPQTTHPPRVYIAIN